MLQQQQPQSLHATFHGGCSRSSLSSTAFGFHQGERQSGLQRFQYMEPIHSGHSWRGSAAEELVGWQGLQVCPQSIGCFKGPGFVIL